MIYYSAQLFRLSVAINRYVIWMLCTKNAVLVLKVRGLE
ncbi:hypothetical protein CSC04_3232 [Enterobacter roggenkampii]|nr:hypothetical protein CSC04_3232 [Enterobacter roggenkampii]